MKCKNTRDEVIELGRLSARLEDKIEKFYNSVLVDSPRLTPEEVDNVRGALRTTLEKYGAGRQALADIRKYLEESDS